MRATRRGATIATEDTRVDESAYLQRVERIEQHLHSQSIRIGIQETREKVRPFIYEERGWWGRIRLDFVLDHLTAPWILTDDERTCPAPNACEAHYEGVQAHLWRSGRVIMLFRFLDPKLRERDFSALGDHFDEFLAAWQHSGPTRLERRLPDELLPLWWECFGGNTLIDR